MTPFDGKNLPLTIHQFITLYSLRSTPFPRVNSVYCYFKIAGK